MLPSTVLTIPFLIRFEFVYEIERDRRNYSRNELRVSRERIINDRERGYT